MKEPEGMAHCSCPHGAERRAFGPYSGDQLGFQVIGTFGKPLLKPPTVAIDGNREIEVAGPDGHLLCFGQLASGDRVSAHLEKGKQR